MIRCGNCRSWKASADFYAAARNGSYCRVCARKISRESYHTRPPDLNEKNDLRLERIYGITRTQWEHLYASQAGVCAICKKPEPVCGKRLAVDHDHASGKIRGLLCSRCNVGIGFFNDSVTILEAAIAYLRKTNLEPILVTRMKSTIKSKINRLLKFLGFNVVKAKRPRARKLTPEQLASLNTSASHRNEKNKRILATYTEGRPPYTEAELLNFGKTHYVGDDCPGGHRDDGVEGNSGPIGCPGGEISRVEQPNSDNGVKGPTS